MLTFAPLSSSSLQISVSLKSTARMSGARFVPVESPFGSAPFSSSSLVAAVCLLPTAQFIGLPQTEVLSTSTFFYTRYSMMDRCSLLAAIWSAEIQPYLVSCTEQFFSSTKYLTRGRWPCSTAVKKGLFPYLSRMVWSTPIASIRCTATSSRPAAITKCSGTFPLASFRWSIRCFNDLNSPRTPFSLAAILFSRLTRYSLTWGRSFMVRLSDISLQSLEISWYLAYSCWLINNYQIMCLQDLLPTYYQPVCVGG